ncbi:hypothetical protein CW745_08030 [Psychromonas sp. psych-6C06]|nr:hypothetical protein CW745_08030 [Psychromonas sp. psych-6C06]
MLIIFSASSIADTNTEIKHLLNFVEKTDCNYQRNGTSHNGAEAREHIQKKYDYYKDDIVTAEDFIAYSATKSMISGKKYTIICQNQPEQYSADWLKKELLKFRTQLVEK